MRAYTPPPTNVYDRLPLRQRAAVLCLLFADRNGDLRVVLTVRSALMRTFAGHVALPGGRADFVEETPFETARREAYEEIGLPLNDGAGGLPPAFRVEHLAELPCSLARTSVGVRPCVAFLAAHAQADVEASLVPRLGADEVAGIFTVPLERFLHARYPARGAEEELWYSGSWLTLKSGARWRAHEFQAPVWEGATLRRYRVWGMTARIVVDLARIAYGRDPDFAHNGDFGDEAMVIDMLEQGTEPPRRENPPPSGEVEVEKGNL